MRKSVLLIPLLSLWAVMALAEPQPKPAVASASVAAASSAVPAGSLVGYLRSLNDEALKKGGIPDKDNPVRYISAYQDLDGDGTPEAIVYMIGRNWCGSGGCTLFILTQKDHSWKEVSAMTISYPPIYVLSDVSKGWHSLAVRVRDMGRDPLGSYEAELSFDGKSYPGNPSVPPARRIKGKPAGKVVIAQMKDATPLYDGE